MLNMFALEQESERNDGAEFCQTLADVRSGQRRIRCDRCAE